MIANKGLIYSTRCASTLPKAKFVIALRQELEAWPQSQLLVRLHDLGWKKHEHLRYFGQDIYTLDGNWVLTRAIASSGFTFLGEHLITCQQYKVFVESAIPGVAVVSSTVFNNQFVAELDVPQHCTEAQIVSAFKANTGIAFGQVKVGEHAVRYGIGKPKGRLPILVAVPLGAVLASP